MLFEQIKDNVLTREVFKFRLTEHLTLVLDSYYNQKRETTRHGWKNVKWYNRTAKRDNNITFDEIIIPEVFIERVKKEIFATIKLIND